MKKMTNQKNEIVTIKTVCYYTLEESNKQFQLLFLQINDFTVQLITETKTGSELKFLVGSAPHISDLICMVTKTEHTMNTHGR